MGREELPWEERRWPLAAGGGALPRCSTAPVRQGARPALALTPSRLPEVQARTGEFEFPFTSERYNTKERNRVFGVSCSLFSLMFFYVKALVCLGRSWHEGPCPSGAQVCSEAGTSAPSCLEDDSLLVPFPD